MESAAGILQLLGVILPLFVDGTKLATTRSTPRSKRWVFYTELSAELLSLQLHLPSLQLRFHRPSTRPSQAEKDCQKVSDEILRYLDGSSSMGSDLQDKAPRQRQDYIYPHLETIRRVPNTAAERCIVPYSPDKGDECLDRLALLIKKLARLAQISEPERTEIRHATSRPSWEVRELAQALHRVTSEVWKCSCHSTHDFMLFLATHRRFKDGHSHIPFDMLFSTWHSTNLKWRESKVFVMIENETAPRVQFDLSACTPTPPPPRKKQEIEYLCAQVQKVRPSACLNMRLEESRLYETRLTASRIRIEAPPTATLQDVVSGLAIISYETRIILAVVLAYSVVHLCGSHWLPSGWDKSSIRFLKTNNGIEYLWRPLLAGRPFPGADKTQGLPPGQVHRDVDRLQLGVALLEIFMRTPIEQYREEEDIGYPDVITTDTNFYTASRIHEEYDWDVYENYQAAVAACLECDIAVDHVSFDDPAYRTYIYDAVIKPLEAELLTVCKFTVDSLDDVIGRSTPLPVAKIGGPGEHAIDCTKVAMTSPLAASVTSLPLSNSKDIETIKKGDVEVYVQTDRFNLTRPLPVSESSMSKQTSNGMHTSMSLRKRAVSNLSSPSGDGSANGLSPSKSTSLSPPLPFASTPMDHEYSVGWICALSTEFDAALKMLDEQFKTRFGERSDKNLYVLGRIGCFNVVMTCLPMGWYGNNTAAIVATRMMNQFPNIKIGLMVGIGGGLPTDRDDIRLGDVVVSKPDGQHGGVVQYDLGKFTRVGFERTGSLNSPPEELLAVLNMMPAHGTPVTTPPALEYPGEKYDRLYQTHYDHDQASGSTCDRCDNQFLIEGRQRRMSLIPHVFYGTIASGNAVIREPSTRDQLIKNHRVLCCEMEAAGLMNSAFPCIVIRGISDYSDSHKNDQWHQYAAASSARYAKDFLETILRNVTGSLDACQ